MVLLKAESNTVRPTRRSAPNVPTRRSAPKVPNHFAAVCKSAPQTMAAVVTPTTDSVTGALLSTAGFYAMTLIAPSRYDQLRPFIASLAQSGPVTTVPLPLSILDMVVGHNSLLNPALRWL